MSEKLSTITLHVPNLDPELKAKCENALARVMDELKVAYFLKSVDLPDLPIETVVDTYFIYGTGKDWISMYESDKTREDEVISKTMTFPKGEFNLATVIEKIKAEHKIMEFTPTCISKL